MNRINVIQYQFKRYLTQKADKILHSRLSKPSQVFLRFSGKCNLKCLQCLIWKNKNGPHINGEELKRIIGDLYSYLGNVKISLSGAGEPFMEPGLLDVCEYAVMRNMPVIINTNGTLIDDNVAKRIVEIGIFGMTISVDGIRSHDLLRGVKGTFNKVNSCIQSIIKWKNYYRSNMRIMINTVITSCNLDELVDLAAWSKSLGVSIKYVPFVLHKSNENKYLWPMDKTKLNDVLDKLKKISSENKNILNSEGNFEMIRDYFENKFVPKTSYNCLSIFDRISIIPNEDVCICGNVIGNISNTSIKEILNSAKANEVRKKLRRCSKNCVHNCHTQGSLINKAKLLYKYCYK